MRFSCDKCAAKYTIADEKVRGKVVAVKCSKCGNRITVNGKALEVEEPQEEEEATRVASLSDLEEALRANSPSSPAPAAAPQASPQPAPAAPPPVAAPVEPPAPAGPTVSDGWYAIIDAEQLGPLPPAETLRLLKAGRLVAQTYVWRDGEIDWKKAEEVGEFETLLVAPPPAPALPPPVPEPAAQQPAAAAPPVAAQSAPEQLDSLLFDDDDVGVPTQTNRPIDVAALVARDLESEAGGSAPAAGAEAGPPVDPFASVPDNPSISKPGEIGEQTRFFMAKAGVTKRNPWWKIAIAAGLFVAVPVAALYALSHLRIVQLELTRVDESTGQEVKTSVFSSEGLSGLRNLLLGDSEKPKPRPGGQKKPGKQPGKVAEPARGPDDGEGPVVVRPKIDFNTSFEERERLASHLKNRDRDLAMPVVDPKMLNRPQAVDGAAGLEPKVVSEVVSKNLKAFQICTENELRRNPSFAGGKIKITLTIGSSGVVTSAGIDKADIDRSDLGGCLKQKAKRIVFPSFEGEAFDVEIPLVLAAGA